jgi:glutamate/tyrosine decarboxylase-like PLP-dependent enzyme
MLILGREGYQAILESFDPASGIVSLLSPYSAKASYSVFSLFHNDSTEDDNFEINDLADLTPQCGRKGDAFKLFLAWAYYGNEGLSARIGNAFDRADQLMSILEKDKDFTLVSKRPLPCLQVSSPYLSAD